MAGAVTTVAGLALVLAPERCGRLIGMEDHPGLMRAIGVSDLLTAPGLFRGRPRWPWLLARTALNAGLVAGAHAYRDDLGAIRSRVGIGVFTVLTVVDGSAAITLRTSGR